MEYVLLHHPCFPCNLQSGPNPIDLNVFLEGRFSVLEPGFFRLDALFPIVFYFSPPFSQCVGTIGIR